MNVDSTPRSGCSWARLRAAGDPGGLPGLVGRMLGAVDGESAREACGRIESNVCPNRMLYGAAEAVVAHSVSALGSGGVSPAGLLAALDLLVEIAYGRPSVIERIEGDEGLARRCRGIIRRSLPVIYALGRADGGQRVRLAVVDLAGRLETSASARRDLLEDFGPASADSPLGQALAWLEAGGEVSEWPDPDAPARRAGALDVREVLGASSDWVRRLIGVDLGGAGGALGLDLELTAGAAARLRYPDDEVPCARVVCEGITDLALCGHLSLADDGICELGGREGAWILTAAQAGLRLRVECAVVRLAGDDGPDDAAPRPRGGVEGAVVDYKNRGRLHSARWRGVACPYFVIAPWPGLTLLVLRAADGAPGSLTTTRGRRADRVRQTALSLNVRDLEISGAPAPPLTGLALLLEPAGSGGKDQELLLTGAGLTTRIRARFTSATWD